MTKINDLFEESTTKAVEEIDDSSIEALSQLCNKLLRVEGEIGNVEERLKRLKDQQRELGTANPRQANSARGVRH